MLVVRNLLIRIFVACVGVWAFLLALGPAKAQDPQMSPSAAFIEKRIGADALTIAQLLDRVAAAEAKAKELQAQLDKRKAEDEEAAKAAPATP